MAAEGDEKLVTENVWTCLALAGFNRQSGVAFLCHIDSPMGARGIGALIEDLRKLPACANDLAGFELAYTQGVHPAWPLGVAVASAIAVPLGGGWVALAVSLAAGIFASTRLAVQLYLKRARCFTAPPKFHYRDKPWFRRFVVDVELSEHDPFKLRPYVPEAEPSRYGPASGQKFWHPIRRDH